MDLRSRHFEPFVHLAGLDDDQALIAWGGFWFVPFADGRGMRVVDDEALHEVDPGRTELMGARSSPYGPALVEAFDARGQLAARAETRDTNHVWLRGLRADTEYRYRVRVNGQDWAAGERMSWHRLDGERGELRAAGRGYDLRFRTFPDRDGDHGLTFCALGDYGMGIQIADGGGERQMQIARALERTIDHHDVRLILTLGDNIYYLESEAVGGSGHEDDDWYFSFYEPYRWLLARVPVYPAVGNHDSDETEDSDDRAQLADNHYTDLRFQPGVEAGTASIGPGLFYRIDYTRQVQFICLDTSAAPRDLGVRRYFEHPEHARFVDDALRAGGPRWHIPFCHHPPYCAGPEHHNDQAMIDLLVPSFERSGVRLVLGGHEHNFQYSVVNGVHYIVSGAGGQLREEPPQRFDAAHTRAWAAAPHFVMVRIDGEDATVWPLADVGEHGELRCVRAQTPEGTAFELPIRLRPS